MYFISRVAFSPISFDSDPPVYGEKIKILGIYVFFTAVIELYLPITQGIKVAVPSNGKCMQLDSFLMIDRLLGANSHAIDWLDSGSNSSKTSRNIGIALAVAGSVIAGVGLGWLIFYYRQKRKQRVASLASQIVDKDLMVSPSSKGLLYLPPNNFTRSIPSFPSLKSDLGRGSSYFGVQVFDYSELEQATNNFDPAGELGDGGFGTVYYGVLVDGRIFAVKRLYENKFRRAKQFMNEIEILARLRHQNLVTLFGVVLIELISSLQAVDTNRHRNDINLSSMVVNKIQNCALHELVDTSLGFETNNNVRRMVTLVTELAFLCLQQERDMRPSMEEVVEALRMIQKDDLNAHMVDIVDLPIDEDSGLLKGSISPTSQDSVY
ncbi:hypothetical protein ACS0TY_011744 [Phlomoides rotata]